MKKSFLIIIEILLIALNTVFLVYNISNGNAGLAAISAFALGTLFMSLLVLVTP